MTRRSNSSTSVRYALEELKFIRSLKDLRVFRDKIAYKLPTLGRGLPSRGTPPVPPSIQIEPTNLCNLNCTTCPGSRTSFPRGRMDMGLFENIVSEASRIGVKRVHLYLRGESTLHPRIVDMIRFVKSHGLALHLVTNGTTLTPERGKELLLAGVDSADQLTVSILGHSKESHEATMVGVDHDAVVGNILGLMRLRKDLRVNGPVIETIFNAPPENQHETDDFLEFWRGKVDHARLGDISVEFSEYGTDAVNVVTRTSPCTGIYERLLVAWDGTVPQCNGDFDCKVVIGDLKRDPIRDVWHCEQLEMLRRAHEDMRLEALPMCLHCDM